MYEHVLEAAESLGNAITMSTEDARPLRILLHTLLSWLNIRSVHWCKCENNGDHCDFHQRIEYLKKEGVAA